ncbi:MAG: hypothetical protein JWP97_3514 [Labilithrix sp.]|nr:hypothetical protein [Labilithrix sp.]
MRRLSIFSSAVFALSLVLGAACSSDPSGAPAVATVDATADAADGEPAAADASAPDADAAVTADAGPVPSSGGKGGLPCTSTQTVSGRTVCVTRVGSVEMKILLPLGGAGALRLGLYLHGDGAAAHKSGSVFKPMIAWADAQHGIGVSFLAPNGCAWWQTPAHDCASAQVDRDAAAENATALAAAVVALEGAYDIETDAYRYYGASGGSIFLTDEWIPLHGGDHPGVFALMCGGEASPRAYAWDPTNAAARAKNPLWFTYGDMDFLLTDEQAAVAAFKGKGFSVTEKIVPGAGHCEFDGHGEAMGIWTAN